MSDNNQGCTWPEQDAVDAWLEKHSIHVDFKQAMELKDAVTKYRIEVQNERDAIISAAPSAVDAKQTQATAQASVSEEAIEQAAQELGLIGIIGDHPNYEHKLIQLVQRFAPSTAQPDSELESSAIWAEICERSAGIFLNGKKGLAILEDDLVLIGNVLAAHPPAQPQQLTDEEWLVDQGLVYSLRDGVNFYEVNVTMAHGSRKNEDRNALANHIRALLSSHKAVSEKSQQLTDEEILSIAAKHGIGWESIVNPIEPLAVDDVMAQEHYLPFARELLSRQAVSVEDKEGGQS